MATMNQSSLYLIIFVFIGPSQLKYQQNEQEARRAGQSHLLPSQYLGPNTNSQQGLQAAYACHNDFINISCHQQNEPQFVIYVVRANYGRFSFAICNPGGDSGISINCKDTNALDIISRRCNGEVECRIQAHSTVFTEESEIEMYRIKNTCPSESNYLEVHYKCQQRLRQFHVSRGTTISNTSVFVGNGLEATKSKKPIPLWLRKSTYTQQNSNLESTTNSHPQQLSSQSSRQLTNSQTETRAINLPGEVNDGNGQIFSTCSSQRHQHSSHRNSNETLPCPNPHSSGYALPICRKIDDTPSREMFFIYSGACRNNFVENVIEKMGQDVNQPNRVVKILASLEKYYGSEEISKRDLQIYASEIYQLVQQFETFRWMYDRNNSMLSTRTNLLYDNSKILLSILNVATLFIGVDANEDVLIKNTWRDLILMLDSSVMGSQLHSHMSTAVDVFKSLLQTIVEIVSMLNLQRISFDLADLKYIHKTWLEPERNILKLRLANDISSNNHPLVDSIELSSPKANEGNSRIYDAVDSSSLTYKVSFMRITNDVTLSLTKLLLMLTYHDGGMRNRRNPPSQQYVDMLSHYPSLFDSSSIADNPNSHENKPSNSLHILSFLRRDKQQLNRNVKLKVRLHTKLTPETGNMHDALMCEIVSLDGASESMDRQLARSREYCMKPHVEKSHSDDFPSSSDINVSVVTCDCFIKIRPMDNSEGSSTGTKKRLSPIIFLFFLVYESDMGSISVQPNSLREGHFISSYEVSKGRRSGEGVDRDINADQSAYRIVANIDEALRRTDIVLENDNKIDKNPEMSSTLGNQKWQLYIALITSSVLTSLCLLTLVFRRKILMPLMNIHLYSDQRISDTLNMTDPAFYDDTATENVHFNSNVRSRGNRNCGNIFWLPAATRDNPYHNRQPVPANYTFKRTADLALIQQETCQPNRYQRFSYVDDFDDPGDGKEFSNFPSSVSNYTVLSQLSSLDKCSNMNNKNDYSEIVETTTYGEQQHRSTPFQRISNEDHSRSKNFRRRDSDCWTLGGEQSEVEAKYISPQKETSNIGPVQRPVCHHSNTVMRSVAVENQHDTRLHPKILGSILRRSQTTEPIPHASSWSQQHVMTQNAQNTETFSRLEDGLVCYNAFSTDDHRNRLETTGRGHKPPWKG